MKGILDRFEGEFAVVELENRKLIEIPRKELPQTAKEGDVLFLDKGNYRIALEETERRKAEIEALSQKLWE